MGNTDLQVPDDLESSVDAGGFDEGFNDGVVSLLVAEFLEYTLVSTVVFSGVAESSGATSTARAG